MIPCRMSAIDRESSKRAGHAYMAGSLLFVGNDTSPKRERGNPRLRLGLVSSTTKPFLEEYDP
jgi:hypothetical protein